jgi:hypothetical protein
MKRWYSFMNFLWRYYVELRVIISKYGKWLFAFQLRWQDARDEHAYVLTVQCVKQEPDVARYARKVRARRAGASETSGSGWEPMTRTSSEIFRTLMSFVISNSSWIRRFSLHLIYFHLNS